MHILILGRFRSNMNKFLVVVLCRDLHIIQHHSNVCLRWGMVTGVIIVKLWGQYYIHVRYKIEINRVKNIEFICNCEIKYNRNGLLKRIDDCNKKCQQQVWKKVVQWKIIGKEIIWNEMCPNIYGCTYCFVLFYYFSICCLSTLR